MMTIPRMGLGLVAAALLAAPLVQAAERYPVAEPQLVVFSSAELDELVGPVALYPDELLAIVLPASTFPLQIEQAALFLEDLEYDPSLQPDEEWDESVVALLNYPEVLRLLNEDPDWTWELGGAVVNQQPEVIAAVERFRERAYRAGNLRSDEYQRVSYEDDSLRITPIEEEIIYVPYYEPRRVVVVQREPVYYYYPRAYPVYYYPYPARYRFQSSFFWGITSAYTIGWHSGFLHVHDYRYASHPYFGRRYFDSYFYYHRPHRPLRVRSSGGYQVDYWRDRHYRGDRWQPPRRRGVRDHYRERGPRYDSGHAVARDRQQQQRPRRDTLRRDDQPARERPRVVDRSDAMSDLRRIPRSGQRAQLTRPGTTSVSRDRGRVTPRRTDVDRPNNPASRPVETRPRRPVSTSSDLRRPSRQADRATEPARDVARTRPRDTNRAVHRDEAKPRQRKPAKPADRKPQREAGDRDERRRASDGKRRSHR